MQKLPVLIVVLVGVVLTLATGGSGSDDIPARAEITTPASGHATAGREAVKPVDDAVVPDASPDPVVVPEEVADPWAGAAEMLAAGDILEAHAMTVGPSGVQMRVERIVHRADATLVRLAVVNGSEDLKQVPHHEVATMTLPDGSARQPIAVLPARGMQLAPGEGSIVVLTYTAVTGPFDLDVGVDGLKTSPSSPLVGFTFEDLDAANAVAGLPSDAALTSLGVHPNGTQVELRGVRFTADRIGVDIEVHNGADHDLWLFGAADTYLEDDLGNRYRALVEPNAHAFYELPARSSLNGVLTFAGRLDPRATNFSIVVNEGGLSVNELAKSPSFLLGPFTVELGRSVSSVGASSFDVASTSVFTVAPLRTSSTSGDLGLESPTNRALET